MDEQLFHLINQHWTSSFLDLFMASMSDSEIWKPLFIGVALFAAIFGGFKGRVFILCIFLALVVTNQLTVNPLKRLIDRRRPKQVDTVRMVELRKAHPAFMKMFERPRVRYSDDSDRDKSGPSFPSGHTNNNTVIALCCTIFWRRWGALYWLVAASVGYSRIYLAAHWPSDVIATLFMAAGETLIVLGLLELAWRYLGRKWATEIFARHPRLVEARTS